MNDQYNCNRIPENIKDLFEEMKNKITPIYEKVIPNKIKQRKNKYQAKMSDVEIIAIQLIIEILRQSQTRGYHFLKANFKGLVNYIERSRFTRTVNNLSQVIKKIREEIYKVEEYEIIDSCPIHTATTSRGWQTKRLKEESSYGYCATKKEYYYGMKLHITVSLSGFVKECIVTKAKCDDREALLEMGRIIRSKSVIGDKGYVGIERIMKEENDINLYALKRKTSTKSLPKEFRNIISRLRKRVETTFAQLIHYFNIQQVKAKSKLGFIARLESKLLCFNLLCIISNSTSLSKVMNFGL